MTDNPASRWDAADYAANAAFVPALGAPVLALLDVEPGERVLDLGCGDGVLTVQIAAAGAAVVGVDASEAMIAAARAKGLEARMIDGERLEFVGAFDAVFSNAALHWMLDGAAVARGVFAALRPGGRFVGEMGGDGNLAQLRQGLREELDARGYAPLRDPQWFPSVADFTAVYEAAGFDGIDAQLIRRPAPLPAGVAGWLKTFRSGFLDATNVPDADQAEVAAAVEARLVPVLRQPDGAWVADYVRLRFSMRKPD